MDNKLVLVGFCGSRDLNREWNVLVEKVIEAVRSTGRGVAVGCAVGADARALQACISRGRGLTFPRLEIFAAFGQDGTGAWKKSATKLVQEIARFPEATHPEEGQCRISVHWWAGGDKGVPLIHRLRNRSNAMLRAVAASGEGRGLVAFVTSGPDKSPGAWDTIKLAHQRGVPVIVFPCGCNSRNFPALGQGRWTPAGKGIWAAGYHWVQDADPAKETNRMPPTLIHCRTQRDEPAASNTLMDGVPDLLGCKPRPAYLRDRTPSLLSLLSGNRWKYGIGRSHENTDRQRDQNHPGKGTEPMNKNNFPSILTICTTLTLAVLLLAGCLSGVILPTSHTPTVAEKNPTLWEYHEHVGEQLDDLARTGCVKATDVCLERMHAITAFPGGNVLTIESYHFHLFNQMVRFTDLWCFLPSDKCLEQAYQAIEPPQKGGE